MGNMARTIAAIGALTGGYLSGKEIGHRLQKARREAETAEQLAAIDAAYTPSQTPVAGGDEAAAAGKAALDQALAGARTDEERAQIQQDYAPTIQALEASKATPASVAHSLGTGSAFTQQAEPFAANDVSSARARARADIYSRAGREDDAGRVLQTEARRRTLSDDAELRDALNPRSNSRLLAAGATDMADATGGAVPTSAGAGAGAQLPAASKTARDPLSHYLNVVAPKAVQTLVKQGRVEEAKRYADFLESQDGQRYAKAYTTGLKHFAVGDYQSAMASFEKIYNNESLFPDGRSVKMTPTGGDTFRVDQLDAEGKIVASKEGKIGELAEQAALMLTPMQAVKFMAEQSGKRKAEAATFDRQTQLERLRQEGQEVREDRRDARLVQTLEARERIAAKRGGLTATQQRSNIEIDAAREAIAGLTPEEIRQRTTPTTASGRENPHFDPQLARAAKLAGRRKVGADEEFDNRQGRQPAEPKKTPKQAALEAMAADPNMSGYTLGEQTMRGFKVLDKDGRHVGYFGRQ